MSAETRRRRAAVLQSLSEEKQRAFQESFRGQMRPVLFEQGGADAAKGLTDNYIRVEVPGAGGSALRNRLLPVRLLASGTEAMQGELAASADCGAFRPARA